MPKSRQLIVVLVLALFAAKTSADVTIVRDGVGVADIVVAEGPPRMTALAAEQLQSYIEKISGAKLPIVHGRGSDSAVHIYVGRSAETDSLGFSDEDLKYGAYRIMARGDAIVLFGRDCDYTPIEPYQPKLGPRETHRVVPHVLEQWDQLTGRTWAFPFALHFRDHNKRMNLWLQDEAGSFNAVCALLRELGVRWYMPGELGEVVPKAATLTIADTDRTVCPDFALRHPYQAGHRFGQTSRDEALWQLRMGFNMPVELFGEELSASLVHGVDKVSSGRRRGEIFKEHPDWFALYGGHRDPDAHCLSSQGLFEEMVRYVRFMFDHYDTHMVSVMPTDGYVNICQCDLCKGKATPQRGRRGQLSDYVWSFVDRIAREVYKTHPDRKVSCFAYGAYIMPPLELDTLSPNVVVGICQTRCTFIEPDQKVRYVDEYREGWRDKLPEGHKDQLLIWEYYLHANHGTGLPVYFPRIIAQDLRDLRSQSMGEFIEVARYPVDSYVDLGIQHLNLYTNARFWWDANQDIDALLDEYYSLYYGPARDEMKAFIQYAEVNHARMNKDAEILGKALDMIAKAQAKVDPESIHGRRIALVTEYMKPLWPLHEQLVLGAGLDRDDNPEAWGGFHQSLQITLDGKPDPGMYKRAYNLVELQSGEAPANGVTTQFYSEWDDNASVLYMYIICREPSMNSLNVASARDGESNLFLGDLIELHIETQSHAYYQIVVNPAGEVVDLDCRDGKRIWDWSSGVEAASTVDDETWAVELRIPVLSPEEQANDPNGAGMAGLRPTRQSPWWINVCRQRVRGEQTDLYVMSPTGKKGFHNRAKLGRFYVGGKRPGILRKIERRAQESRELELAEREDSEQ